MGAGSMKKIWTLLWICCAVAGLSACGETTGDSTSDQQETISQSDSTSQGVNEAIEDNTSKALVVYFSATNTTEGIAEKLATGLEADLYEIVPQEVYTEADLTYSDSNSRATLEMNDPQARPAISGTVENMEQYDIIFLGYPIWWGDAPRIIDTFLESYDFSGKTVIPFCTSGSSAIDASVENLKTLATDATWLDGQRFAGNATQEEVMEWVHSLNLNL